MPSLLPRTLLGRTVLVLIVTVALTQVATQLVFRQFVIEQYSQSVLRLGTNNMVGVATGLRALQEDKRAAFADALGPMLGIRLVPVSTDAGPPAGSTSELPERLQRLEERLRERLGPDTHLLLQSDIDPPHVWFLLPVPGGNWWAEVQRNPFDRAFPLSAALLLGLSIGLAVAVAWITVRRINQPLREVQDNILALSVGADLPHVATTTGPAEIDDLAQAVARTAQALRQNDHERALLLAGISHDLRTPLSRIRLSLEFMPADSNDEQQAMVQDLEEIDRIIDQFLDFARNPEVVAAVPGDLSVVAEECGHRAAQRIEGLSLDLEPDLPILLRRPTLDRLINNLLENARRYAHAPITLQTRREGAFGVMRVLDRGPGIPPELVPRLLQPFTRLDVSRTGPGGAGLGLAIVDRIARAHGARLELLPRQGGGLEARVAIPLDRSATAPSRSPSA